MSTVLDSIIEGVLEDLEARRISEVELAEQISAAGEVRYRGAGEHAGSGGTAAGAARLLHIHGFHDDAAMPGKCAVDGDEGTGASLAGSDGAVQPPVSTQCAAYPAG